jgi:hypothetical protein
MRGSQLRLFSSERFSIGSADVSADDVHNPAVTQYRMRNVTKVSESSESAAMIGAAMKIRQRAAGMEASRVPD